MHACSCLAHAHAPNEHEQSSWTVLLLFMLPQTVTTVADGAVGLSKVCGGAPRCVMLRFNSATCFSHLHSTHHDSRTFNNPVNLKLEPR